MMQRLVISFLLIYSGYTFSKEPDLPPVLSITPVQVSQMYDSKSILTIVGIQDLITREEKIKICVSEYIEKRTKTYAKIPQVNLYDMMHNFGRVVSRIYGSKVEKDDVSMMKK